MFLLNGIRDIFGSLVDFISSSLNSILNGTIVGLFRFLEGVLNSLEHLLNIIPHAVSSFGNLISGLLSLGAALFPFIPAEWTVLIESALIVLAIGLIIRKKVVG